MTLRKPRMMACLLMACLALTNPVSGQQPPSPTRILPVRAKAPSTSQSQRPSPVSDSGLPTPSPPRDSDTPSPTPPIPKSPMTSPMASASPLTSPLASASPLTSPPASPLPVPSPLASFSPPRSPLPSGSPLPVASPLASPSELPSHTESASPAASTSPRPSVSTSQSRSTSRVPSPSRSQSQSPSPSRVTRSPSASRVSGSRSPSQQSRSPGASKSPARTRSPSRSRSPVSASPSESPDESDSPSPSPDESDSPSTSPVVSESPDESESESPSPSPYHTPIEPPSPDIPDVKWTACDINGAPGFCTDLYFCVGSWQDMTSAPLPPSLEKSKFGFSYLTKGQDHDDCIPGYAPVIRMAPGKTYKITWHNTADQSPAYLEAKYKLQRTEQDLLRLNVIPGTSGDGNLTAAATKYAYDEIKVVIDQSVPWLPPPPLGYKSWASLDIPLHTTNVHLHGVHVSGQGNHDNALRIMLPGECMESIYPIPLDHMGGTFSYHAQFHGRNALTVIGGAYGMVVIQDQPATNIGTSIYLGALDTAVSNFLAAKNLERVLVAFREADTVFGNGDAEGAKMTLVADTWFRLRMLLVKPSMKFATVEFKDPNGKRLAWKSAGPQCEIYDIAQDGVYFTKTPWRAYGPNGVTSTYSFEVLGTSRLDLAIRCLTTGNFTIEFDDEEIARVKVNPEPTPNYFPDSKYSPFHYDGREQWIPLRPDYLVEKRETYWGFAGFVSTIQPTYQIKVSMDGFNNHSWDDDVPLRSVLWDKSTIYEFNFTGIDAHPVHIHQQHFQIVEKGGCGALREGQFYDTISSYANKSCRVRVQFIDFSGKQLLQSGILEHQDMGIMTWFDVPAQAEGSFEASEAFVPYSPSYHCCVPRMNDDNAGVVCKWVPECGSTIGLDSCNQPCTVPYSACPGSKPHCSGTGVCFRRSLEGVESISLDPAMSDMPTPMLFIFVAVGLSAAVAVVISILVVAQRRKAQIEPLLLEPSDAEMLLPTQVSPLAEP